MYKRNNNPRELHDGHFTAHIGLYPKFSTFVAFYKDSIEKLFKAVSEGNETADVAAIPLLFLMRHTLELGYKFSLVYLCHKWLGYFRLSPRRGAAKDFADDHPSLPPCVFVPPGQPEISPSCRGWNHAP